MSTLSKVTITTEGKSRTFPLVHRHDLREGYYEIQEVKRRPFGLNFEQWLDIIEAIEYSINECGNTSRTLEEHKNRPGFSFAAD